MFSTWQGVDQENSRHLVRAYQGPSKAMACQHYNIVINGKYHFDISSSRRSLK